MEEGTPEKPMPERELGAGSFGHGGAYKTVMWIEPKRQLVIVLMRQHSGPFLVPDGSKIEQVFVKAAIDQFGSVH